MRGKSRSWRSRTTCSAVSSFFHQGFNSIRIPSCWGHQLSGGRLPDLRGRELVSPGGQASPGWTSLALPIDRGNADEGSRGAWRRSAWRSAASRASSAARPAGPPTRPRLPSPSHTPARHRETTHGGPARADKPHALIRAVNRFCCKNCGGRALNARLQVIGRGREASRDQDPPRPVSRSESERPDPCSHRNDLVERLFMAHRHHSGDLSK